jgi:aminoglycoside/choline kinase family phosphotransferase
MDAEALARQRELIATIGEWWPRLERLPRTLVHDDFNPRNIALRLDESGEHQLKAFDWELATLHVPQYDLAELLAHTLEPDVSADEVSHYLELHRRALSEAAGRPLDPEPWREGFALALRDFTVNRLAFTFVAHVFREHPFLERVFRTTQRLQALMDHG